MKLKDYLLKLLGKSDFNRLNRALRDGKAIIVSGAYGSGKTTLVKILKKSGYQAVEDFDTYQVTLKKPLDSMIPDVEGSVAIPSKPGTSEKC